MFFHPHLHTPGSASSMWQTAGLWTGVLLKRELIYCSMRDMTQRLNMHTKTKSCSEKHNTLFYVFFFLFFLFVIEYGSEIFWFIIPTLCSSKHTAYLNQTLLSTTKVPLCVWVEFERLNERRADGDNLFFFFFFFLDTNAQAPKMSWKQFTSICRLLVKNIF